MTDQVTPQDAQSFLDENFAQWVLALQLKVTGVESDGVVLEIPITDDLARTGGIVSGQALAALADTAMVLACGAAQGQMGPVGTVTLDTQFLRPGSGTHITADARVTRLGRSLVFAQCKLIAHPSGKPVALASATFAR